MRFLTEEVPHEPNDLGHASHASDQHHLIDVLRRAASVGQGFLARFQGPLNQVIHQLLELRAGELYHKVLRPAGVGRDKRQIDFRLLRRRQLDLGPLSRFFEALERHAVLLEINALVLFELIDEPIHDPKIEVVSAQERIAVGGFHFENAFADLESGNVERAAAKIVDGDALVLLLIETISQRRRGRLVDDAQHRQSGDLSGILGGLALAVIEIRGHRDNRFGHRLPKVVFRRLFHLLKNHGRDFGRAVTFAANFNVGVSIGSGYNLVGQPLHGLTDLP